jgi:FemAB-related protein (PEP-CTERM system-associated)
MVSQALSDYGGPLWEDNVVLDALYAQAVELALEYRCDSIEFRNTEPLPYDLSLRTDKMTMHLPLLSDPEELWNSFRPEIRNRVRKAEKSNLVAVDGGVELLDAFYSVWTVRMHQLGTPCYSRKILKSILEAFPNDSRIFLVYSNKVAVGAGLTTCFNGLADMQWVATLTNYNKFAPNNLLYWSVIRHYSLDGASWFDFGRCTVGGPTYEFKRRWGAKPVPLYYQYWIREGHQLSIASPENPKYKRKVELWKKLPLWTTRLLGPFVSRSLV